MRLNIYNIYPACYKNFAAIKDDLPRIRGLGFNVIYLNQFLEADLETIVGRTPLGSVYTKMRGSLYATTYRSYIDKDGKKQYYVINLGDPANRYSRYSIGQRELVEYNEEGKEENSKQVECIRKITSEALKLGMVPIFDLVLAHAGVNCAEEIKRHLNIAARSKDFDDVFSFRYDNEECVETIFYDLWKPLVEWYINDLGFLGVRIDAVFHINTGVTNRVGKFIEEILHRKYESRSAIDAHEIDIREKLAIIFHSITPNIRPIVFGEMINDIRCIGPDLKVGVQDSYEERKKVTIKKLLEERMRPQLLHAGNSIIEFTHSMCWAHELRPLTSYVCGEGNNEELAYFYLNVAFNSILARYGVIAALETHDRLRLQAYCNACKPIDINARATLIKEKILLTMMANGGWYLICGNEFGLTLIKDPPFLYEEDKITGNVDKFRYEERFNPREIFSSTRSDVVDLTEFIKIANYFFSYMQYPDNEPPIFYCAKYKSLENHDIFLVVGNFIFHGYTQEGHKKEFIAPETLEKLGKNFSVIEKCYNKVDNCTYIAIDLNHPINDFTLVVPTEIELIHPLNKFKDQRREILSQVGTFVRLWSCSKDVRPPVAAQPQLVGMPLVIPYIQQHFLPGFNGFANRYTGIKQDITKLKTMECAGIASLWQDMKIVCQATVDLADYLDCIQLEKLIYNLGPLEPISEETRRSASRSIGEIKYKVAILKTMECAGTASFWQDMRIICQGIIELVELADCLSSLDPLPEAREKLAHIKQHISELRIMPGAGTTSFWQDMKLVSIALVDLVEVLSCAAQKVDIFEKQRRRLAFS